MRGYNWMKVVDVMTKNPVIMTANETVREADRLMVENGIRQLPVVDGSALLGIITDRDIRSYLANSLLDENARTKGLQTPVREIMTTEPLTLAPDDDLRDAVELLVEEKIGGVPVVDEAEGVVGIVTYVDILRCFLHRLDQEE